MGADLGVERHVRGGVREVPGHLGKRLARLRGATGRPHRVGRRAHRPPRELEGHIRRLGDTKGAVSAAQLGALQQLEADNFLYAAAGQASVFQGWVAADIA